ncbi:augmin complex subunit dgt3 [Wyeomyia smithii]|uniref:augmin complex subunit dgt3 n=1 Tax=Wyeomyia smithii TaxID=174621 RepID=UPI002467FC1C|nr:augmin complex subunit dgt3 [Wyeomyia smithii]
MSTEVATVCVEFLIISTTYLFRFITMEESGKNLGILKRISGIDVSRLWLLHDESFKEFFDWFGQSVDEDNLITDSLLREYGTLENDGLVLSDEEVQRELKILEQDYPNILVNKDSDVQVYEEKLEQLMAIEEEYERLIADAKKTEISLTRELSDLELKIIDAEFNQGQVFSECTDKATFLNDIQSSTQQQIFEMHQCYVSKQNPPLFIYQMPIEQFNMKCDQFLKYLEMYIRRHFSVRKLDDSDHDLDYCQDHRDSVVQLESIKARLNLGELKLLEVKKEYHGLSKMMDRIHDLCWQPMKISAMRKMCTELTCANEQDRLRIDVMKQELEMYVRQSNEQRIEGILYENTKLKLDRAVSRLEYIKKLAEIISRALMNAEMLWVCMHLDLEKIKNKFDNSDELNSETQRCLKRIEALNAVEKNHTYEEAYEEFVAQFSALLGSLNLNHSSGDRSISLKNCVQDFADYRTRVFKNLQSVVGGKYYKNMNDLMEDLEQCELQLLKYVYDGPVNGPQFFDQQYQERIQRLDFDMKQIENALKTLKTDYQQNINEPKNNEKFWRYRQNLWVWFLTEPKKVAIAIKEVTAAATQMAAYKSISGIKCKSMVDDMKF